MHIKILIKNYLWVCAWCDWVWLQVYLHYIYIYVSLFVPYIGIIFHIWSIYRHTHNYKHCIYIQYICHLCAHVSISQRTWWLELDTKARDKMYDALWDLLVLKFCKTRVNLGISVYFGCSQICEYHLTFSFTSYLKSRNYSPLKIYIWRIKFYFALWAR